MSQTPISRSSGPRPGETSRLFPAAVRTSVLARLLPEPSVAVADVVRDLGPMLSHRLAAGPVRDLVGDIVAGLLDEGLAREERGRIALTASGQDVARALLMPAPLPRNWNGIRDCRLVALAIGLSDVSAAKLRALATPEGVRAAVLQRTYGLPSAARASAATLRNQLAVVALEKAFGDGVKGQIRARDGLPAKTARVIAAQLARRPRDPGADTRLVATLAAEAAGAFQTDADAVRTALLRRWVSASLDAVGGRSMPAAMPEPLEAWSPQPVPVAATEPARPLAANRPGLDGFVRAVQAAAEQKADGWPGNRKAPISRVFDQVTLLYPAWGLGEAEFKAMLLEAHRLGRLSLATADLKSRDKLGELERSAVAFKNAVLHFIRVDA